MVALCVSFIPSPALAYYNYGTVGITPGASSLSVVAGQTTQTSVSVSPASDDQTLGCGMAKCPQVCDSEEVIAAGYNCFDMNGNCTCAGAAYSTYYPEVSVSSSNAGVATAQVSGNTLVVTGVSAGSATITISASLRQWTSNSTTVQVEVSAPATNTGTDTSGGTNSSGNTQGNSGETANTGGNTASAGNTSTDATNTTTSETALPEEATVSESRDDALNETVVETVAGTVYSVEINDYLDTKTELEKIVGTTDQVVFWKGTASDKPDYSWTFVGDTVDATSAALSFDPEISVSKLGSEFVANIMKQSNGGLVLEFAHEGQLPGTPTLYISTSGVFADGTTVSLYVYDADAKQFVCEQADLAVTDGYVSFTLDHCSTWALSADDLSSYSVEEENTPRAIAADEPIGTEAPSGALIAGVLACALLVTGGVVAFFVVRRRKKTSDSSDV